MAERSIDASGASTGSSVGTQTASSESLPMDDIFNYIRGMNSKLDMVVSRLDDIERQRGTRNEELVSTTEARVQAEMAFLSNKVDDITQTLNETKADISELSTSVADGFETLKADIVRNVQEVAESLDNRIAERLYTTDSEMTDGFDSLRANMRTSQTRLEETIGSRIGENKEHILMKIDGAVDVIKENTYRAKREIFAVTEKEAQLVRDYKAGLRPLSTFHSYSFDFYVEDFGYLVSSGRKVHSLPWQINQFKSCVVGKVQFFLEDKMEIWMVYGRDPRRVGFRPNFFTNQIKVRVTATIIACRDDNQNDKTVGSETWCMNEEDIVDSEEKGVRLGEVPCMELVTLGYAKHENKSVLVRYDVKIE